MSHANKEAWEMTHDRRDRTTELRKNQNAHKKKGNLQVLGNIGKYSRVKEKTNTSGERENYSQQYSKNLIKGINTWAIPLV